MLKIILLLSFFALSINAQTDGNYNLVFNAKIGIMFPGPATWNFSKDPARSVKDKFHTVNPNYYFGGGIESNNLIRIKNARLNFAIEICECYDNLIKTAIRKLGIIPESLIDFKPLFEQNSFQESKPICPNCSKDDVKFYMSPIPSEFIDIENANYECTKCGYKENV